MSILNILKHPNPALRQKSKEVSVSDIKKPEIQKFIKALTHTMVVKDGIGLSAPQVGKLMRIIAINKKEGSFVLINPKIVRKSWKKNEGEEGCLSLPGIFGLVKRNSKIKVCFYDKTGEKIILKTDGLFARVIQHEFDHLEGVLFIDKTKKITKGAELLKSNRDEK